MTGGGSGNGAGAWSEPSGSAGVLWSRGQHRALLKTSIDTERCKFEEADMGEKWEASVNEYEGWKEEREVKLTLSSCLNRLRSKSVKLFLTEEVQHVGSPGGGHKRHSDRRTRAKVRDVLI